MVADMENADEVEGAEEVAEAKNAVEVEGAEEVAEAVDLALRRRRWWIWR